jgi:hypothetical protein
MSCGVHIARKETRASVFHSTAWKASLWKSILRWSDGLSVLQEMPKKGGAHEIAMEST